MSSDWENCHALAEMLTARTCHEFQPSGGGGSRATGARINHSTNHWGERVGLDLHVRVTRWGPDAGDVTVRGSSGSLSVHVGGRGWLAALVDAAAPWIDARAAEWAAAVAHLLESDAAQHAARLVGAFPFSYRRDSLPPGWRDLNKAGRSTQYRGKEIIDDATTPITLARAWEIHEALVDPPGYEFAVAGLDRDRRLFTARWAGANTLGPSTPKDRAGCRADAWAEFWGEGRAMLLDAPTRQEPEPRDRKDMYA